MRGELPRRVRTMLENWWLEAWGSAVREDMPSPGSRKLHECTGRAPALNSLFASWLGSSHLGPVSWTCGCPALAHGEQQPWICHCPALAYGE